MCKPISPVAVLIWAVAISVAVAADNPPSDASIKQLLEVVEMRKLPEAMTSQLDGAMKQAIQQATQGEQVPASIQQDIDKRQAQMIVATKETLDWNKLEPVYVRVYQKSLTQQEVDGLIAFYKTPSGQAVLKKMPVIMQNAVNETQQLMQPLVQQLRTMQQEVRAKVQAEKDKKGG
jgi:uncharacterized protein